MCLCVCVCVCVRCLLAQLTRRLTFGLCVVLVCLFATVCACVCRVWVPMCTPHVHIWIWPMCIYVCIAAGMCTYPHAQAKAYAGAGMCRCKRCRHVCRLNPGCNCLRGFRGFMPLCTYGGGQCPWCQTPTAVYFPRSNRISSPQRLFVSVPTAGPSCLCEGQLKGGHGSWCIHPSIHPSPLLFSLPLWVDAQ